MSKIKNALISVSDKENLRLILQFLKKIANKIHEHGLVTPAVFFLEMTKPLSLLGSHFLVFFGPIINSFIRSENYYRTVEVFEEPKNVELLLTMIEEIDKNER